MLQSNAAASRLALDYQASACTDITGFGLAGHLLEMLGPDQCVRLDLSRVPLLDGALDCIAAGMRSSMHSANMALERHVQIAPGVDRTLADMVFDPQTSGGLLIGVDAASAADFCSALQAAGCRKAAVIGTVQYREGPEHPALWLESVR
jgi:selenide,water dikinase